MTARTVQENTEYVLLETTGRRDDIDQYVLLGEGRHSELEQYVRPEAGRDSHIEQYVRLGSSHDSDIERKSHRRSGSCCCPTCMYKDIFTLNDYLRILEVNH